VKLRYKIGIALAVVLLPLVGFGIYIATDEARQRAILISAIEASIGGTIEIEGNVSFTIGRTSSFAAERLTFALPDAASTGTIGRIRVSIDTLSAIDGPLIIEELLVEQGEIRVEALPGFDDAPQEAFGGDVSLPVVKRIEILNSKLDIPIPSPDDYSIISVDELTVLQAGGGQELEIAGEGLFDDIALALTGGMGPFEETPDAGVNAPLRLTFSSTGGRTTLVGTIFDIFKDAQLDVAVTADSSSGSVFDRVTEPLALQNVQINLAGRLLGPIARPRITDLAARIESDDASLEMNGQIGDPVGGAGLDLQFNASLGGDFLYRRVAGLPQSLGLDRIDASGRVEGGLMRADLSELNTNVRLAGQAVVSANGRIAVTNSADEFDIASADLAIQINAPNAQLLGDFIDDNLATVGVIEGAARLAGSDGQVALEGIDLLAGKDGPVRMRITGRIPWVASDIAGGLEAAELSGMVTGDDVKDLSPILGFDLPSVGPIELDTAMRFRGDDLFFTDTSIGISGPDQLQITATGSARVHDLSGGSFLDTIDAAVRISSATSTAFLQTLDIDLPELGATAGTVQITGDEDTLKVNSIDVRFRDQQDVNVAAMGQIEEIDLLDDGIVRDLGLNVTVDAPSVTSIAQRVDFDLPELGPVRATARLLGKEPADAIAVESFLVSFGLETEPVLSIAGTFDDITNPSQGTMNASVRADSARLSEAMNWPSVTGLKTVRADMQLSAQDGSLGIEQLTLESENSDAISITALGMIDDLLNFDEVDVDIVVSAPDADIFAPALEGIMRPRGALEVEGKVVIAKPDLKYTGGFRLGDNDIEVELNGTTAGERPSLSGTIAAKRLALDDFGIDAESRDSLELDSPGEPEKQRDYVFGKDPIPFDGLFAADLDLTITADTGRGLGHDFETLNAKVRLQDGRLSLDPLKITYEGGAVKYSGVVDASADPPAFEMRIRATDFELSELLLYVQDEPTAAGDLTGEFELASRGFSAREIAENLSGSVDLALENGRVNGINLHVLSTDALETLFSLPNLTQSTEVRCGIARFDIESGVAKSQALLIATPRMTLSGAGWIDFGDEKMDITLSADPKSFVPVVFQKPVRFHGEFTDLDYSTASAQTGIFGGVFGKVAGFVVAPFVFAPVSAAGSLVGLLRENGNDSPCLAGEKPAESE
jgi:hypothetical protein